MPQRGERSDAELAARAAAGDARAFEALVRRTHRAVLGAARRTLGPGDAARDAAQEIYMKAWDAMDRFDATRAFVPWIMTIAHNHLRDRLRRLQARPGDVMAEAPELALERLTGEDPGAEHALAAAEEWGVLAGALEALPEHYRDVVVQHHLEDRSVSEIAEALDRPAGTVMTWLYRARARLKDALREKGLGR